MRIIKLLYLTLFGLLAAPLMLNAQDAPADTSFIQQAVSNSVDLYRKAVGTQAHLYTGPEYYVPFKSYVEGHQFFKVKTFEKGSVLYDGTWFYDVPMLYDLDMDEVVTIHPGSGTSQRLVKQKVDFFKVNGHTFINLKEDSITDNALQSGFYDLLHNGQTKLLARHEKQLQERTSTNGLEGYYNDINKFYIKKDGVYYQVNNKSSVLKVLNDKKKELKEFSRSTKIKFRNNRDTAILKMVQHYDSLSS